MPHRILFCLKNVAKKEKLFQFRYWLYTKKIREYTIKKLFTYITKFCYFKSFNIDNFIDLENDLKEKEQTENDKGK